LTVSLIYFVFAAIFLGFPILLRYGLVDGKWRWTEILFALSITEFVIVGMVCSAVVFADVLKICLGLWDRWRKTNLESRITPGKVAFFSLAAVACVVFYGCFEAWNVRRVDILIPTGKLPPGIDRKSGLTLLDDRSVEAGGIVIVGLDDYTEMWPPPLNGREDRFVLLLKHHPQIPRFGAGKFDLVKERK
jgi:hypothetical protein